jgi:hypothetical protein
MVGGGGLWGIGGLEEDADDGPELCIFMVSLSATTYQY